MKQKNFYQKPETCVIANEYEKPLLAISGSHPDFEENDDEWGDGGGAKETFFDYGYKEESWFN